MATTLNNDARVVNNDDLLKRSVPAPKHDRDTSQAVADIVTAFDNIVGGSKQQADLLGDTSNNAAINNLVEILVPKAEPASATNLTTPIATSTTSTTTTTTTTSTTIEVVCLSAKDADILIAHIFRNCDQAKRKTKKKKKNAFCVVLWRLILFF